MKKIFTQNILPTIMLCIFAVISGAITGALTAGFGRVLLKIGTVRTEHLLWFLPLLPLSGMLIVWVYKKYGGESSGGMGLIFESASQNDRHIPLRLIPILTISTWITHLCGGSAGREGVAVQLGAAVSDNIGKRIRMFREIPDAVRILTISGMAAGFSGLFHAPIAAVCFSLEVLAVGKLEYYALLPASVAAVTANLVSSALGLGTFSVTFPEPDFSPLSLSVIALGILSGLTGGLFTFLMKQGKKYSAELIKNPVIRVSAGGIVLATLLYICGHGRYTGLGTDLISLACSGGKVYSFDFILKLLFTVFTLSIGFQGGEVTPLFATGACLGAFTAPLFGIPSVAGAALCYAAVFGSASNTLLAPVFIGAEVFGFSSVPYFVVVCTVARLCNGNRSMYGKQKGSPLFLKNQL